jgi:hypothetical protein
MTKVVLWTWGVRLAWDAVFLAAAWLILKVVPADWRKDETKQTGEGETCNRSPSGS